MTDKALEGARVKNEHLAATTVGGERSAIEIDVAVRQMLADDVETYQLFTSSAPGGRGTEVRVVSERLDKHVLKEALRKTRALLEAGEIPTGASHT